MQTIKIRWKEGLFLLIFLVLSGLYFFGIPNFSGILDYKYAYYYEELIGFFLMIVLPTPFLVGVFLFSVYKTEKRIKKGKFSFWKLLFFGLIISLMAGLLWETILGLFSSYDYGGSDVTKKLLSAYFWRFHIFPVATIFIFSLTPSLIFYRFKGNIKKFHIAITILFLFIFAGLFGYKQAGILTCGFNYDGFCVGDKALKLKEISLCEKVKTTKEFSNFSNYGKYSCYVAMSKKWEDASLCDKIKTISSEETKKNLPYSRHQEYECVKNIAKNTGNKELCEKVTVSKYKERCYDYFKKK